jgi:plasmid stability protein
MCFLSQAPHLGGLHRTSRVPFRGSFFTASLHPLAATPQRLNACLYRRRGFPPITSLRFVAHRDLDALVVEKLKARAAANGRSLQAELKAIIEAQASQVTKAEARALAARIRRRIGTRLQTDSGMLQAEDRER